MSKPSPATIDVVQYAFMSGAEQMRRNLYRSAHSPVIYEMKDCSVGIYDSNGDLLGQAPGLPFFLGSLGATIQKVIKDQGEKEFLEGEIWIVNDSAICGSHLNDVTVFMPIFSENRLLGFSGTKAHWNDVGAKDAGYVSDSTSIFQEGLRIPVMRIASKAGLDLQLSSLLSLNSRFPKALIGDLQAQIAACRTGHDRFLSIIDRYGVETVLECIEIFFAQSEVDDRKSVSLIPDGIYQASGHLDSNGLNETEPVFVSVRVEVSGENMTVDLAGSSSESRGSINSGIVQTISAIQMAFKFIVNPELPATGGNFRNLNIKVPAGTCFDPSPEAACLHYGPHLMLAIDLIVKALSPAVPERTAAGHVGDSWNIIFVNDDHSPRYLSGESLVGGWGAWEGSHGESAVIHSAAGDFKNAPVETMEHRYPLMIERNALRVGSGGKGKWNGGDGIERFYITQQPCYLSLFFERTKLPSWGLFGGTSGKPPKVTVITPDGVSKDILIINALRVDAGTRVEVRTGGGGGWGVKDS
jgi:N-methylhydantoinase B